MKTITINTYSFNELSEEAQKVAIQEMQENPTFLEYDWYEGTYDHYFEIIKEAGFEIDKIYFSGFWSQGDGAMFEYSSLNDNLRLEFIESLNLSTMRKDWLINNTYATGKGIQRGHYYHENSCDHSIYFEVDNGDLHYTTTFYQWLESFADDFEEFIIQKYKNLCTDLYAALEKEYYYLKSDEAVKEYLEQDEYKEYLITGEIYN
jgi:hypothetical protein